MGGLLGICTPYAAAPARGEACGVGTPADGPVHSGAVGKRRSGALSRSGKGRLLRRVSLDLTGLPPTARKKPRIWLTHRRAPTKNKWIACWPPRATANAGLLCGWTWRATPIARDTKRTDRPGVWPYRDWVIDAFNRNLPYDQFVIKQLAGDLLPNATFEHLIATSFHRQTPNNDEGGTDDEEFRLVAVMDRGPQPGQC